MMNENDMNMMELTDADLEAVAGGRDIVATAPVKVYMGPGLDFSVLGYMDRGEALSYAGDSMQDESGVRWYRVRYRDTTGWVSSRYSKKR